MVARLWGRLCSHSERQGAGADVVCKCATLAGGPNSLGYPRPRWPGIGTTTQTLALALCCLLLGPPVGALWAACRCCTGRTWQQQAIAVLLSPVVLLVLFVLVATAAAALEALEAW